MINLPAIEALWRGALERYAQSDLRGTLQRHWKEDANLKKISYDFPPTFQPGYVGTEYAVASPRILFLVRNPGTGLSPEKIEKNKHYADMLEAFARGKTRFAELNTFIADEILNWDVYARKGIFRESNDSEIDLLRPGNRPSVQNVSILNSFPFKTLKSDTEPQRTEFWWNVWNTYVYVLVELLRPDVLVVCFSSLPKKKSRLHLIQSCGRDGVIPVLHPGNRNLRCCREKLKGSWQRLDHHLDTWRERP